MIVPVALNLVVVFVIIAMDVRLHDLVIIRATIVRAILRTDQRRCQSGHGESRTKRERFPKILAHITFLVQGGSSLHAMAAPNGRQLLAANRLCRREPTPEWGKYPSKPMLAKLPEPFRRLTCE